MNYTEIEQEVIFLKAINESIDSMVNYAMIILSESEDGAQAIFETSIHQKYFNIILVDFLSKTSKEVTGKQISCLDALVDICNKPNFNMHNSVKSLRRAVKVFKKWLECEIKANKVWLSSISLQTKIKIRRQEFIEICGDISKHNFLRLSKRVSDLQKILSRSNEELSDDKKFLIIDDFYIWFHDNIFNYHGSYLVEQLNNIRWGIHDYLQPEFKRSYVYEGGEYQKYHYTYPSDIKSELARYCYWKLMNETIGTPIVKRFKTYKMLRLRY